MNDFAVKNGQEIGEVCCVLRDAASWCLLVKDVVTDTA